MAKRLPHGEMVHLWGKYYRYSLVLLLLGGMLLNIGFGLLVPIGWKAPGVIILILGGGCVIATIVYGNLSLRWDKKARGRR